MVKNTLIRKTVRENVIKVYALKIDCVKAVPRLRR
jgi:hypothetical protein